MRFSKIASSQLNEAILILSERLNSVFPHIRKIIWALVSTYLPFGINRHIQYHDMLTSKFSI